MENLDLNKIKEHLPFVSEEKNYWLVRTSSGKYYKEYVEGNFIAIGWNEVTFEDLFNIHNDPKNKELFDLVKSKIIIEDRDDNIKSRMQTRSLRQLLKFTYDIKRGDIVIIPSYSSDDLSFGEVTETPIYEARGAELINCKYIKRKRIRWIKKDVNRHKLDFDLYKFIFAHQTINNVSEYAEQINVNIYDFYLSGENNATFVLRVKKGDNINTFELTDLFNDIVFFIDDFATEEGIDLKANPVSVKLDLQSPGVIVLEGLLGAGLLAIAFFTILAGGDIDISAEGHGFNFKGKFKANSLLDKISDYLDRRQDRKAKGLDMIKKLRKFEVSPNSEVKSLNDMVPENPANDRGDE